MTAVALILLYTNGAMHHDAMHHNIFVIITANEL